MKTISVKDNRIKCYIFGTLGIFKYMYQYLVIYKTLLIHMTMILNLCFVEI